MRKADLTTRVVAGFIDLLIVLGLTRLPDVIGILAAAGYILIRDGLFANQSIGKKLIGLRMVSADDPGRSVSYRESIIRNTPPALAYLLFLIPYAGWLLGSLALGAECLVALGDERGMRIGDMLAGTWTVRAAESAGEQHASRHADSAAPAESAESHDPGI